MWVSRGLEWTRAAAHDVIVAEAEPLLLRARLRRAVSLPGWWSADLHIHTKRSGDSPVFCSAPRLP